MAKKRSSLGRTRIRKRTYWTVEEARQTLAAWERSGLSMAAFCRERGIRPKRLYWWRSRLAAWSSRAGQEPPEAQRTSGSGPPGLVEAVVMGSGGGASSAVVALALRSGDRIEVACPAEVDGDWLVRVARGLCATEALAR